MAKNKIEKRQEKEKKLMLNALREMPIVAIACEKSGIGRTTYYNWLKEDKTFARQSEDAASEGDLYLNDMAHSQMVVLMKDKHWPAIHYRLKNRHPDYTENNDTTIKNESLTSEQEAVVRQALRLVVRPEDK